MKIKDCLKIFQKITAIMILIAMFGIAGCGAAESDVGEVDVGKVEADVGEKDVEQTETTEVTDMTPVEENASEEAVDILDRKKPVLKSIFSSTNVNTTDGRTEHYEFEGSDVVELYPTNKFIMVEEVADPGERNDYVKVKGTLYEVFFYGSPDYDLVYFPGDELPEGYEVKVTDDYELVLGDDGNLGEGHIWIIGDSYIAEKGDDNKISYKNYPGYTVYENDTDPPVGIIIEPGMYGMLAIDEGRYESEPTTLFVQALLKDQMPTDGTEVSDDIMHQ